GGGGVFAGGGGGGSFLAPFALTTEMVAVAGENSGNGLVTLTPLDPDNGPEPPTLMAPSSRTVPAGGSTQMLITASPADSDDTISVTISGVPHFESITAPSGDTVTSQLVHGGGKGDTRTFTITAGAAGQAISGLVLNSTFPGKGHPVNTFTVTASNSTSGETGTSAAKTITVTDPPLAGSAGELNASAPGHFAALMNQFMAAGFHNDHYGAGAIASSFDPKGGQEDSAFLATPHFHTT
ncbi:hypothetical protein H8B02_45170, partial [Bradyrhizobium sp. Pear77]|nr:hypothetical protein [Bradyrhizobium altum]